MNREKLALQKGSDWYGKQVAMPNGSVVRLFPDDGWNFNPGKAGLNKVGPASGP